MDIEKIREVRVMAEKAVMDMPEGELKVKAFEVILNKLLNDSERSVVSGKPASIAVTRNDAPASEVNDTELTSGDLDGLKRKIDAKEKISALEGALVIAGSLEEKGQTTFGKKHIEKAYKALIRAGCSKLPIVKDFKTLVHDVTRTKLWFEKVGRGEFRISDSGIRMIKELEKTTGT